MGSYGHMLCRNTYSAVTHPFGRCFAYAQHDGRQSRHVITSEKTSEKAGTLSAEFCRHVVKIVIDVLFHGERFGYIEVDRLLTVASDNAVGFTFH